MDPLIIKVFYRRTPENLYKMYKMVQYFTCVTFEDPLDPLHGPLGVHGPLVKNIWPQCI